MGDDVRRLIIALFGVLAVLALAAPAAAGSHTAARIHHHASRHPHPRVLLTCGYLRMQDGSGEFEASALPNEQTSQIPGTFVTPVGIGGWQVCYEADDHALYLKADSGECFAVTSDSDLVFHGCNDDRNQTFYEDNDPNGLVFTNPNSPATASLCIHVGVVVSMSSTCSADGGSYHLGFSSSPGPG
jgi:hypothetical protein